MHGSEAQPIGRSQAHEKLVSCLRRIAPTDIEVLLTGPTGVGKTWIVCALGNQAARESHVVLYTRLNRLLDDLAVARLEGGANRLLRKLARVAVLILDDFAMTELTAAQRRDLMEVIDDRHERGATVIATQVPVERWHHQIGDPTYADAILDRLVHQAYRIDLKGESLRKTRAGGESLSAASSGGAE